MTFRTRDFRRRAYQMHAFADGYRQAGMSTDAAVAWANRGFTPDEAAPWIAAGFDPDSAASWADEFVSPTEAQTPGFSRGVSASTPYGQ
jgi:hypothetical protein